MHFHVCENLWMIFTWTITELSIVWVLFTHRLSVCVCVLFVHLLWELGLYRAGKVDVYLVTGPGRTPFLLAYITRFPLNLVHVHVYTTLEKLSDMTIDSVPWSHMYMYFNSGLVYTVHGMIGIWKYSQVLASSTPYDCCLLCGHFRYGTEILLTVPGYSRAILGQCCACSMTRKSSLLGPVTLPYG